MSTPTGLTRTFASKGNRRLSWVAERRVVLILPHKVLNPRHRHPTHTVQLELGVAEITAHRFGHESEVAA
jgi:hypothetical protein